MGITHPQAGQEMTEMNHITAVQSRKWPKWVITTPCSRGNWQNESLQGRATKEMGKMSHYNAKQFWKWLK